MINPYNSPIVIIDIGAAQPDHVRWQAFPHRVVVGFEPNLDEFRSLCSSKNVRFYNIAVGSVNGTVPLYVTGYWSNSSILRPNIPLLKQLAYNLAHWEVVKEIGVACSTLDDALSGDGLLPNFIKVDTQGSELSILSASPRSLANAFGLEIEVEFLPLYEGQPLFEDVQSFMRQQGFQLMDLGNRLNVKGRNSVALGGDKSNLISADALYFRSLDSLEPALCFWGVAELNAATAVCMAYGYDDYAFELCLRVQQCNSDLQAHALDINKLLSAKIELSILQRIKRAAWIQAFGKLFRAVGDRIVIDKQFGKTACWFSGVGN
ncbi:FkbM family methyltransferase [Desulfomicrobium salsuginis]